MPFLKMIKESVFYWIHTYWLHHEPVKAGEVWYSSVRPSTYFTVVGLRWNQVYGFAEGSSQSETFPIHLFQSIFHKRRVGKLL